MEQLSNVRLVILGLCILAFSPPIRPQKSQTAAQFVIDAKRPFVYLRFDHIGKGARRNESESDLRVWLRFVNNCNMPIRIRAYGVPEGSLPGEAGVMDRVVVDPPMLEITAGTLPGPEVEHEPSSGAQHAMDNVNPRSAVSTMPSGYESEVSGGVVLPPGNNVLFSVPVDHLGSKTGKWHMEIPFQFVDANGKFPRDPLNGGEAMMSIWYSLYDLPDDARAVIANLK